MKSGLLLASAAAATILGGMTAASAADAPVALVISQGGLGDGAWNDTAYAGFKKGLEETGLEGRPIESNDVVAQGEEIMRRAAQANFGLVISLEYTHGEAMEKIAPQYPDTDWVITNQVRKGDNIASVVFGEHEGSFLAGALAAQVTTDTSIEGINEEPVIGVIGGVKSTGIDKFIVGYIQGAKAVNPDIEVKVAYADSFGDPAKGNQMAKAMFNEGADIVYQVAGGTGIGIIEAAKSEHHYAIGVDTDQDAQAKGWVLTSVLKRVDVAVADVMKAYANDKFPGGQTMNFGLAENGVALSNMTYTKDKIPAKYVEKVQAMKKDIIDGKIDVWNVSQQGYPDFYK